MTLLSVQHIYGQVCDHAIKCFIGVERVQYVLEEDPHSIQNKHEVIEFQFSNDCLNYVSGRS